jgi:hypothetical protein
VDVPSDRDEVAIRSYLLGRLPEPEAEALEDEYLARPEVWERVRGVEDDLLDDYAAGRLAPAERAAFETKYLASPPLRERVAAARALRSAAGRHTPARPVAAPRATAWRAPLAIAASVLVAVAVFWMRSAGPRPTPSASPRSTSIGPSPTPVSPGPITAPAGRSVVLALSPVLLRGPGGPAELRIPPGTETVVLEMEGDPAAVPRSAVSLEIAVASVDGGPVWSGEAVRASDVRRPSLLATARVPAARLGPEDYVVTLRAGTGDGAVLHRYFVRVVP